MEPEHDQRSRPNEARYDLSVRGVILSEAKKLGWVARGIEANPRCFASLNMIETVGEQKITTKFLRRALTVCAAVL